VNIDPIEPFYMYINSCLYGDYKGEYNVKKRSKCFSTKMKKFGDVQIVYHINELL